MFASIQQKVSPKRFLMISKNNRENIKSVRFVFPKLGNSGYGYFLITYNHYNRNVKPTSKATNTEWL